MLDNPNVFPVDIAESKRLMDLYGKKIYSPSIMDEEEIPVVVVAVPSHGNQIRSQVKENHKKVKQINDICQLVDHTLTVHI
jgi:hypothetical protein